MYHSSIPFAIPFSDAPMFLKAAEEYAFPYCEEAQKIPRLLPDRELQTVKKPGTHGYLVGAVIDRPQAN